MTIESRALNVGIIGLGMAGAGIVPAIAAIAERKPRRRRGHQPARSGQLSRQVWGEDLRIGRGPLPRFRT